MVKKIKVTIMLLFIMIMVGNLGIVKAEAKQVEVKSQAESKVKIYTLNSKKDEELKEIAFKIKNKTDEAIKVKDIRFQEKKNGQWTDFKRKSRAKIGRNIKINENAGIYESIWLSRDYVLPLKGLPAGKYGICIRYIYKGKSYYTRRIFVIEEGKSFENEENPPKYPSTIKGEPKNALILNTDFSIDKKGQAMVMFFSEGHYKKTCKVKIEISVQKYKKGKWKTFKKYKRIKKSNIGFLNRSFKIKKSGKYRMYVKAKFYLKNNKVKTYKRKTKILKFNR